MYGTFLNLTVKSLLLILLEVLGKLLFTVHTGTLAFLLEAHGVSYHFFGDDTQLYIRVENIDEAKHRLSSLMSDLKIWMARRT